MTILYLYFRVVLLPRFFVPTVICVNYSEADVRGPQKCNTLLMDLYLSQLHLFSFGK